MLFLIFTNILNQSLFFIFTSEFNNRSKSDVDIEFLVAIFFPPEKMYFLLNISFIIYFFFKTV